MAWSAPQVCSARQQQQLSTHQQFGTQLHRPRWRPIYWSSYILRRGQCLLLKFAVACLGPQFNYQMVRFLCCDLWAVQTGRNDVCGGRAFVCQHSAVLPGHVFHLPACLPTRLPAEPPCLPNYSSHLKFNWIWSGHGFVISALSLSSTIQMRLVCYFCTVQKWFILISRYFLFYFSS